MFCDDLDRLVVWQRPAACADAAELGRGRAESSASRSPSAPRTASLLANLRRSSRCSRSSTAEEEPEAKPGPDIYRDRRSLHIHHGDLAAFKRELARAFDLLAERYYLNLKGEPKVTVGRDAISVRFSVEKDD